MGIDEMLQKLVQIERYYLFSYVNTISSILNTLNPALLRSTMENWNTYSGSQELTYTGLVHALQSVNTNAFICVWTDEIGNDTNNQTLLAQILSLKASTNSEIFIMAVTKPIQTVTTSKPSRMINGTEENNLKEGDNEEEELIEVNNSSPNDNEDSGRTRSIYPFSTFYNTFKDVGHVMDVTNDPDVVAKMINMMKNSALCN